MNDELMHYGVKGMKWGVRRDKLKNATRRVVSKVKAHAKGSDDAAAARKLYRKGAKQLSNTELQKALYRMNLEQNYKRAKFERLPWARKVAQRYLEKRAKKLLEKKLDAVMEMGTGQNAQKIRDIFAKRNTDPAGFQREMMDLSTELGEKYKNAAAAK